jgi:hypothetical protein
MSGYRNYKNVGAGIGERMSPPAKVAFWVAAGIVAVAAIVALGFGGAYMASRSSYIQTLSGVGPTNGEVTAVAGNFISVVPNPVTSQVLIHNTGVGTINGMTPLNGEITLVGGTAVSVVNDNVAKTVTFNNDGVTSLAAQDGVAVDAATGAVTVSHVLTTETLLPFGDPLGPQVSYIHAMGIAIPALENTWRMGAFPGFFPILLPGVVPGDDGQGNGGVTWTVPAVGQYAVNAHCVVQPSAIVAGDHQSFTMALNLGAATANPNLSGFIPFGGSDSLDISSASALGPMFPLRMSVSTNFHAGCTGCPVLVGDALTVHIRHDHFGAGPAVTFQAACKIQVSREK